MTRQGGMATRRLACGFLLTLGLALAQTPASLTSAFRESPTPARKAALLNFAKVHPRDQNGALARLGFGVASWEQESYPEAIEALKAAQPRLPALADYTAYFLAAAAVASEQPAEVPGVIAKVAAAPVSSPLVSKAVLVEAQALNDQGRHADAVRTLVEHYGELAQPDGDLALAASYEAAGDLPHAAAFYQQVYYRFPAADAAQKAGAALVYLQDRMASSFPQPSDQLLLERGDRLMGAHDYARARLEFETMLPKLSGPERDRARVRMGTADYLRGSVSSACAYLEGLELGKSDADAERLYYLAECARRKGDDEQMMRAVKNLGQSHAQSSWRLRALISAANRFLLANRIEDYEPLFAAAWRSFPADAAAPSAHWKYAWAAYIRRKHDAEDRLREHLRLYAWHPTAAAALYFLGRTAENSGDYTAARAWHNRLVEVYPNYYYGVLGQKRLAEANVIKAVPAVKITDFLSGIAFPQNEFAGKLEPAPETAVRIERARLLRSAGLPDLADTELRFGARAGGQPVLLAMELARSADSAYGGLRAMKSLTPNSLAMPLEGAPKGYWELLFPLPYHGDLMRNARQQGLDPSMVAALIRQESEFNPQARSSANAYGLTQVRPSTGRQLARRAGLRRFSSGMLLQPAVNLRLGTIYLRGLLDQLGGSWEETLAAYNAGKSRVNEWEAWGTFREPAEFVETIPFTETREYVQSVLRNAELYRRIYGDRISEAATARRGSG
jgi:soluble lytic murein transglycosylase